MNGFLNRSIGPQVQQMSRNSTNSMLRLMAALAACGFSTAAHAEAREWFDLDTKALATVTFEGLSLPTSIDELKEQFPQAKRTEDRVDRQVGLECYEVADLKSADLARYYFLDGALYQLEVVYDLPRVKQMGGMQALVQRLVDVLGPADHVGQRRWTWQRAMYLRRADFYTWPDHAQLSISDTSLMPIITSRLQRHDRHQGPDLGF